MHDEAPQHPLAGTFGSAYMKIRKHEDPKIWNRRDICFLRKQRQYVSFFFPGLTTPLLTQNRYLNVYSLSCVSTARTGIPFCCSRRGKYCSAMACMVPVMELRFTCMWVSSHVDRAMHTVVQKTTRRMIFQLPVSGVKEGSLHVPA